MELGLFLMPSHPPERGLGEGAAWDLDVIARADALGYSEVWVGEHFTAWWEPCPAPDLLLAQAILRTERIRLAPGAHLLPYHHPAELADRVAYLDHLAQGRLMFGVGVGGVPTDFTLFGVDGKSGENREMMWEALDIILGLWNGDESFDFVGKYWSVSRPVASGNYGFHIRPYQQPHPPIGITALSPGSDSLRICGERGYMPLSLNLNPTYVKGHWAAVEEGARSAGRVADPTEWRVVRDVFVADTDEAAWTAASTAMGRMLGEFLIPQVTRGGQLGYLKHDPEIPDDAVTAEYLLATNCLVGSVDTVVEKLARLSEEVGTFGTLLTLGYDYSEDPEPWFRSMELLAEEVMPRLNEIADPRGAH